PQSHGPSLPRRSSELVLYDAFLELGDLRRLAGDERGSGFVHGGDELVDDDGDRRAGAVEATRHHRPQLATAGEAGIGRKHPCPRSEEHTSELQSPYDL